MQTKRRYHATDDNPFDHNGLLRDGRTYRSGGLMLMDHNMPPDRAPPASRSVRVVDGHNRAMGLHAPGWRIPAQDARPLLSRVNDAQRRAVADARADYENRLVNSWRGDAGNDDLITGDAPAGAPPGAYPYTAAAEGKSCSVNGAPGTLVRKGNWLVCRPTNSDADLSAYGATDEKQCPDCGGTGEIDGEACDRCDGSGILDDDDDDDTEQQTSDAIRRDHRTVAQMMRDHQNMMADIYDKLDHELSEKWRRS